MAKKVKRDSQKIDRIFRERIDLIVDILKKQDINYDRAILFGSVARGDARDDSDIDICLLVSEPSTELESIQLLANNSVARAGIAADIIVTTSSKFKKDLVSPLFHEIRTYGVAIGTK